MPGASTSLAKIDAGIVQPCCTQKIQKFWYIAGGALSKREGACRDITKSELNKQLTYYNYIFLGTYVSLRDLFAIFELMKIDLIIFGLK